ncbi:hypothetical protein RRF57_012996 [Xylaria bambusicola]|uniref:Uncharacterized protein n=1 Tax=Xylaria bambusicola TaxID=326684 RepID=A0AAN7UR04_9PEZI
MRRCLEEEEDNKNGHTPDWKIYVEAPAPGQMGIRCKEAAEEGTDHAGDAKDGANHAYNQRHLVGRAHESGNRVTARKDARGSSSLNDSAHD